MATGTTNASPTPKAEDMARHAECMEEIKRRVEVVEHFLSGQGQALYLQTTVASIALQLRAILELIALASLVANRAQYTALREQFGKDYRTDWHPMNILRDIERINPGFYPRPTRQVLDPDSGSVRETVVVDDGYLTRDELETLHGRLGRFLHADNQFAPSPDYRAFLDEVPGWLSKITTLLNHHQVQLVDNDHKLWVLMHAKEDGCAHVWLFEKVADLPSEVLRGEALPVLTRQEWLQTLDEALDAGDEAWVQFIAKANGPHPERPAFEELNEDADAIGLVLRR